MFINYPTDNTWLVITSDEYSIINGKIPTDNIYSIKQIKDLRDAEKIEVSDERLICGADICNEDTTDHQALIDTCDTYFGECILFPP